MDEDYKKKLDQWVERQDDYALVMIHDRYGPTTYGLRYVLDHHRKTFSHLCDSEILRGFLEYHKESHLFLRTPTMRKIVDG